MASVQRAAEPVSLARVNIRPPATSFEIVQLRHHRTDDIPSPRNLVELVADTLTSRKAFRLVRPLVAFVIGLVTFSTIVSGSAQQTIFALIIFAGTTTTVGALAIASSLITGLLRKDQAARFLLDELKPVDSKAVQNWSQPLNWEESVRIDRAGRISQKIKLTMETQGAHSSFIRISVGKVLSLPVRRISSVEVLNMFSSMGGPRNYEAINSFVSKDQVEIMVHLKDPLRADESVTFDVQVEWTAETVRKSNLLNFMLRSLRLAPLPRKPQQASVETVAKRAIGDLTSSYHSVLMQFEKSASEKLDNSSHGG